MLHQNWATTRLDEIGEIFCGQSVSEHEVNRDRRGVLYVTGPEQWTGTHIEENKWTEHPRRLAPAGCIFITVKGAGVGKTFPGVAAAIGRDIYAYKPAHGISVDFVHRAIRYRIGSLVSEARGDIPGLSRGHLADYEIALPPLAEQRRIVFKLDTLSARIVRARSELERVVALTGSEKHIRLINRLEDSLLAKAFRGELVPQDPEDEPASVLLDRIRTERATAPKAKRRRPAAPAADS